MAALKKFDPRRTISIRGFDRRGCGASIHDTSATGFEISGYWSDLADFWVFLTYDADDVFGHLQTSKYLPDFDHSNIVLDFDLSIVNGMYPGSIKFPSVPWNEWSWILEDGTSGTTPINITSTTGGVASTITYTVNGILVVFDRVQLIYNSNITFDYIINPGDTTAIVAQQIVNQINAATSISVPISATRSGSDIIITCTETGEFGNTAGLYELHKTATTYLTPANSSNMSGGVDPTSFHVQLDLTLEGLDTVRQLWLTGSPKQPIDNAVPTIIPFTSNEFSYTFTNWGITDPSNKGNFYVPNKEKSVIVGSRDARVRYAGTGWGEESGFFYHGFARSSNVANDTITVRYSCQYTHDVYLGTSLYSDRGSFGVVLDGVPLSDLDTYANVASNLNTRRLLTTGITSGTHVIVFTVKTGSPVYFDYLHAVIPDDPIAPTVTYSNISAACDFDTDQTYKIPPSRLLWIYTQLGFLGDVDFYAGVFFALKRRRRGGFFHSYICTVAGLLDSGTGFGDGDSFFIVIGGTSLGVSVFPQDTLSTVVDRFVNGINNSFVGVRAENTGVGELTVTVITPINGFFSSISSSTVSATWAATGSLGYEYDPGQYIGGNEGIWEIDDTATSPLNKGFEDYLIDFAALFTAAGITQTLAFSQELLAPPDIDMIAGAYIQRFADGSTVLTSTGFGSWGRGYVESIVGSTVKQIGHGYIPGYIISDGTIFYTIATTPDADHYTLVSGLPMVGATIICELQTSQCNFNPLTTTAYISKCYEQASVYIFFEQFGEVGWWFFPGDGPLDTRGMAYYDKYTADAANTSLGRPLATFTSPDDDPSINTFDDADFLRDQVETHIATITGNVLGVTPAAKFEILFPYDVNYKTSYINDPWPFPIGGRLNRYVNLPISAQGPGGSLDRFKIEALAWGTSYRNLTLAIESMQFYLTDTSWDINDVIYLVPWQNGGCPWVWEYWKAVRSNIPTINFWALDHIVLFSWPVPFIEESEFSQVN